MSNSADEIALQVNGETVYLAPQIPLIEAIARLGYNPRAIAIEYNGEILPRQEWENTKVEAGDKLEVVTIVGGGR